MKIIHFDCFPIEKKYHKKKHHEYIDKDVNSYLKEKGSFEADIISCFVCSKFDKSVIDSIKNLKLIITRSVGIDNIDTKYCDEKGIKYINIEYPSHNVAHHTIALILSYARQLNSFYTNIRKGNFSDKQINCPDLKNMKLGIIGYGRIGKQVAELAQSLGLEILAYDRNATECTFTNGVNSCDLESILKNADIISLHCDANPTSIGMINEKTIKLMKDGVILINTARGCIINEKDLIKNIKKFSFVGLDVLDQEEKFSKKHPFLKHSNIFITPHIAYKSEETTKERWIKTYKQIDEFTY